MKPPEAPARPMAHEWFAPSAALEPFIAHYWTVRWDFRGKPPFLVETLPHPCVHLLFERGRALVGGVSSRRFTRKLRGLDRVFGIKFRPGAFAPFLRDPLSRITNRLPTLRSVFGKSSDALKRSILAEEDPRQCVALSEAFLLARLPSMPPQVAELRDLVERLATDQSITRVEQAAALAGVNVRGLQRRFSQVIGVSPKWVIKRYRLHEAISLLSAPNGPDMASLALQLGYFDQAHFIADFKAVIGRPPGAYVKARRRARPGSRSSSRVPREVDGR